MNLSSNQANAANLAALAWLDSRFTESLTQGKHSINKFKKNLLDMKWVILYVQNF